MNASNDTVAARRPPTLILMLVIALAYAAPALALTAQQKYYAAEACHTKLLKSPKKQKYRHNWLSCIDKFYGVYRHDPSGRWAAAGLFQVGRLFEGLYRRSGKKSDRQEALDTYQRLVKRFPKSRYRAKAVVQVKQLTRGKAAGKKPVPPKRAGSSKKKRARPPSPRPSGRTATVSDLRFWSNPSYTRVVIDVTRETGFAFELLKSDVSRRKPPRLYVDVRNSKLKKDIRKFIPIHDDLLIDVRAAQYRTRSVRVVVDIKSFKTYKIFSLQNPFRIVIDVWGTKTGSKRAVRPPPAGKGGKLNKGSLSKQLALGVSRVVIDPGHGGRDFGAPGYYKGVYEKKIVLAIARKLARKIRQKLNLEVVLTRNRDTYLGLEERTAIANTKNADLFISIHTNASRDRRAYGLETYYLNLATDDDAVRVAARENALTTKKISDLQKILFDLMHNAKVNESSRLAGYVQEAMVEQLKTRYSRIKNKGVKQAPFYVLLGAQMPAILIETAFISNSRECKRLMNDKYQDRMTDAIVTGLKRYIRQMRPTAGRGAPNRYLSDLTGSGN